MAAPFLSWIASNSQQSCNHTQETQLSYDNTQGATCQPLENASPLQYSQHHQPQYSPRAFMAQRPTMQFTQSPPPLAYDSSPDQQYSDMEGFGLDYDILNNLNYLNNFNFTDYTDFDLLPAHESLIQSPYMNASFFPSLDSFNVSQGEAAVQGNKFACQFAGCTESFPRQCELTRHEHKHTRPFRCPHCERAFAEKRRCIQHIQTVHDLATDKDKTQCHLCKYAHVRPDAVKRHLRLKHGVGAKFESSPPTASEQSESRGGRTKRKSERR